MTDINHIVIVGRLTRDLGTDERSFAYLPSGQARANVSIAVNRSRKQGDQWVDEANYFDVTIWGKTAENLKPYLTKGKQIAVDGYLKQDRWEKDGQKQSRVSIVANNVQLLGGKSDGGQQSGGYTPRFSQGAASSQGIGADAGYDMGPSYGGSDGSFPEDIPF
ncbi:MAG: single-stranded DNA-binding protein [Treponema sp.]|nr:single-stranded DNA-binding protein [Treponema sp.]